ncbi:MAG: hypothetical protein MUC29_00405 [Pyrinomonadaceae bacterium]|jgi:hypothetical protein|nr:hypothetical protein [Pyrinomonadaceae bacterium]
MLEILSNPFYLTPLAILIGCAIGLSFNYFYYLPKYEVIEKRLRDKAQELYSTRHALEKTRYELVQLASDSIEQDRLSEDVRKILADKNQEILLLREEITILEKSLLNKQNIFSFRSDQKTQTKLAKVRSKQQQLLFPETEVVGMKQRKSA